MTSAETETRAEDRTLVTAFVRRREERAFRALYRRHTPRLMGLAVRLLGQNGEAEDAVQETWCRAVGRLDTFRWEAALATWLSAILIRHCRERWRKRDNEIEMPDDERYVAIDDCSLIALADRVDLTRAIAALPDGYRYILVLHDVEGYKHAEIASLLEIEIGTSKSQLSRARRALRRRLAVDTPTSKGASPHA
jgi:RNA polymerase sigma-70 factor (ECF subfamily)